MTLKFGDQEVLEQSIKNVKDEKEQHFIFTASNMYMDIDNVIEFGKSLSLNLKRLNYWINIYEGTIIQDLNYI